MTMFTSMVFSASATTQVVDNGDGTITETYTMQDNSNMSYDKDGTNKRVFTIQNLRDTVLKNADGGAANFTYGDKNIENDVYSDAEKYPYGKVVVLNRKYRGTAAINDHPVLLTTNAPMDLSDGFSFKASGFSDEYHDPTAQNKTGWEITVGDYSVVVNTPVSGSDTVSFKESGETKESISLPRYQPAPESYVVYTGVPQTVDTYTNDTGVPVEGSTGGKNPLINPSSLYQLSITYDATSKELILAIGAIDGLNYYNNAGTKSYVFNNVEPSVFEAAVPTITGGSLNGMVNLYDAQLDVTRKLNNVAIEKTLTAQDITPAKSNTTCKAVASVYDPTGTDKLVSYINASTSDNYNTFVTYNTESLASLDLSKGFDFSLPIYFSSLNNNKSAHGYKMDFGTFYVELVRDPSNNVTLNVCKADGTSIQFVDLGTIGYVKTLRYFMYEGFTTLGEDINHYGITGASQYSYNLSISGDANGKIAIYFGKEYGISSSISAAAMTEVCSFNANDERVASYSKLADYYKSGSSGVSVRTPAFTVSAADYSTVGELLADINKVTADTTYTDTFVDKANDILAFCNTLENYDNGAAIKNAISTEIAALNTYVHDAVLAKLSATKLVKSYPFDLGLNWAGKNPEGAAVYLKNSYVVESQNYADKTARRFESTDGTVHFAELGGKWTNQLFAKLKATDLSKGFNFTSDVAFWANNYTSNLLKIDFGAFYIAYKPTTSGAVFTLSAYNSDDTPIENTTIDTISTTTLAGSAYYNLKTVQYGNTWKAANTPEPMQTASLGIKVEPTETDGEYNVTVAVAPYGTTSTKSVSFTVSGADFTSAQPELRYSTSSSKLEVFNLNLDVTTDKTVGDLINALDAYKAGTYTGTKIELLDLIDCTDNITNSEVINLLADYESVINSVDKTYYAGKSFGTDFLTAANFDVTKKSPQTGDGVIDDFGKGTTNTLNSLRDESGNIIYGESNGDASKETIDFYGYAINKNAVDLTYTFDVKDGVLGNYADGVEFDILDQFGWNYANQKFTIGNLTVKIYAATFTGITNQRVAIAVTLNGTTQYYIEDATAEEVAALGTNYHTMNISSTYDCTTGADAYKSIKGRKIHVSILNGILTLTLENHDGYGISLDLGDKLDLTSAPFELVSEFGWTGGGSVSVVDLTQYYSMDVVEKIESLVARGNTANIITASKMYAEIKDITELASAVSDATKVALVNPVTFTAVSSDAAQGTVTRTPAGEVYAGEQVTLTATAAEGYVFTGWYDQNNKLYRDLTESTVVVTAGATNYYKAQFAADGAEGVVTITVKAKSNREYTYSSTSAPTIEGMLANATIKSAVKDVPGYNLSGWKVEATGEILAVDYGGTFTENVTLIPTYTKQVTTYTVSIDGQTAEYAFNTKVNASSTNDAFTSWKDNGTVVSYAKDYTFFVGCARKLISVNNGAVAAQVIMNVNNVWTDADGTYVYALTEWALPEGYTIKSAGVIMTKTESVDLTDKKLADVDNDTIRMATTELTTSAGQYMVYTNADANFKVKGFLTYEFGGTETTVYTGQFTYVA